MRMVTAIEDVMYKEKVGDQEQIFPELPSDRPRGNGHKLKHHKLLSDITKNFFNTRVAKYWNRDLDAVDSPSTSIEYSSIAILI